MPAAFLSSHDQPVRNHRIAGQIVEHGHILAGAAPRWGTDQPYLAAVVGEVLHVGNGARRVAGKGMQGRAADRVAGDSSFEELVAVGEVEHRCIHRIPGIVVGVRRRHAAGRHDHIAGGIDDGGRAVVEEEHDPGIVGVKCSDGAVVMMGGNTKLRDSLGQSHHGAAVLRVDIALPQCRSREAVVAGRKMNQSIVKQSAGRSCYNRYSRSGE